MSTFYIGNFLGLVKVLGLKIFTDRLKFVIIIINYVVNWTKQKIYFNFNFIFIGCPIIIFSYLILNRFHYIILLYFYLLSYFIHQFKLTLSYFIFKLLT